MEKLQRNHGESHSQIRKIIGIFLALVVLVAPFLTVSPVLGDSVSLKIISPTKGSTLTSPNLQVTVQYSISNFDPTLDWTIGFFVSSPSDDIYGSTTQGVSSSSGTTTFNFDMSKLTPGNWVINAVLFRNLTSDENLNNPEVADAQKPNGVNIRNIVTTEVAIKYNPSTSLGKTTPATTDDPIIVSFTASPKKIKAGEKVKLTWEVTGAASVKVNGQPVSLAGSLDFLPTEARFQEQITTPGNSPPDLWTSGCDLSATGSSGKYKNAHLDIEITPLTIDEIFDLYVKWGNTPYTFPDGTRDETPLVGPSALGSTNNFVETVTWITGVGSYEGVRWDCVAMQYKTLVFLNDLKKKGVLCGWDYMPVDGVSAPYANHEAVAIWQSNADWSKTSTIFDPHGWQKPYKYSVNDGFTGIAPWSPNAGGDWGDMYPSIPGGSAKAKGKYLLNDFETNTGNRWQNGTGATTPWQNTETIPQQTINILKEYKDSVESSIVQSMSESEFWQDAVRVLEFRCPVDVVITNSAGQRLGIANGKSFAEFKPVIADYIADKNGEKQWFFILPKGDYRINVTGTGTGNFNVLTYSGVAGVNDFGDIPITPGQQAVVTIKPGAADELTLADGTKVTPKTITLESLLRPGHGTSNTMTIVIVVVAVVFILLIIGTSNRRRASRIKPARVTAVPKPQAALRVPPSKPLPPAVTPNKKFCTKCGNAVSAGEKFCKKCGAKLT